jgi:chromosome segregation ATPase
MARFDRQLMMHFLHTIASPDSSQDAQDDLWWNGWQLAIVHFTQKHSTICSDSDIALKMLEDCLDVAHKAEVDSLRQQLSDLETRLRESQSQRAIFESVISERLVSERAAVSIAQSLRDSLHQASKRCAELTAELNKDRHTAESAQATVAAQEEHIKKLEAQLTEVENFMSSKDGSIVLRLETELASCRLALAAIEEEKDELEAELADCQASYNENNQCDERANVRMLTELECKDHSDAPFRSFQLRDPRSATQNRQAATIDGKENQTLFNQKALKLLSFD